jgi:hypothetical protein
MSAFTKHGEAYLGDGVYVSIDRFRQVELRVRDADGPSRSIYLEPEVLELFEDFIAQARKEGTL